MFFRECALTKNLCMYYSPIQDIRVGSRRSSCQAITLVDTSVIDKVILLVVWYIFLMSFIIAISLTHQVGLDGTFRHAIEDIEALERRGFVDPLTDKWLPVIVIAGVGDNLQQNENGTLTYPFLL